MKTSKGMESLVSHKVDYSTMSIAATFAGLHDSSKLKFFNSGFGVIKMDELKRIEAENVSAKDKAISYKECNRNHAIFSGGYAVDGCGEFMPSGEEGTIESLKCAACDCHRNYHRKEVEVEESCDWQIFRCDDRKRGQMTAPGFPSQTATPHPLALPSPSQMISPVNQFQHYLLGPRPANSGDGDGGFGRSPSTMKKRFRTKFTSNQREKMGAFSEKLGWRIQKHDEPAVQEFCSDVGVKRHVLKVWMHNNKNTLGKKVDQVE